MICVCNKDNNTVNEGLAKVDSRRSSKAAAKFPANQRLRYCGARKRGGRAKFLEKWEFARCKSVILNQSSLRRLERTRRFHSFTLKKLIFFPKK